MNDTGTRNAIFILRNICERSVEVNKDLYLCFIDFTKALDRVRHTKLLNMLQDLDLDGKIYTVGEKFILGSISCNKIPKRTWKFHTHKKRCQTRMRIIARS